MLLEKARETVKKYQMLKQGDTVIVGVSGGADSLALLHVLTVLQEEWSLRLRAVHVHHGLRGEEADHDARFVTNICKEWNVSCKIEYCDVADFAKKQGIGVEEAGRQLRYEVFHRELEKETEGKIAVAHNQNDQAETVLMRLCRGSGLKGLCGIAPVRERIIRPLLYCSRQEIEEYCRENSLDYCTDGTNSEDHYTRNKIRIHLLPWLEEQMNPKAVEHIASAAQILWQEEAYLETETDKNYKQVLAGHEAGEIVLQIKKLLPLPQVMRQRVLRKAVEGLCGSLKNITSEHIGQIESLLYKGAGKRLSLPYGICVVIQYENIRMFLSKMDKEKVFCSDLPMNETIYLKEIDKTVKCSLNAEKNQGKPDPLYTKVFDYDKIKNMLTCRSRRSSDILSIGGGHTKKLKNFFIDEKIPVDIRSTIPLITCGNEVLWVVGYRTSAKFGVHEDTSRFLWIQIWEGNKNE